MITPLLGTERLFLTPLDTSYAEDVFHFASDPEVAIPAWGKIHRNLSQSKREIEKLIGLTHDGQIVYWAIVPIDEFKKGIVHAIGLIGLGSITLPGGKIGADVSYILAAEYRGKGLMTEVLSKVIHYAFLGLGVSEVRAWPHMGNKASMKVLEKCGVKQFDYTPKTKPISDETKALCKLTCEEFMERNNYSADVLTADVYRRNRHDTPRQAYLTDIEYTPQPNEYQCGQACVAMIAGVSVREVCYAMTEEYGTSDEDICKGLDYYKIPHTVLRKPFTENTALPDCCILSLVIPGDLHWSLYYKGKYYDPQIGIVDKLPEDWILRYYWEIPFESVNEGGDNWIKQNETVESAEPKKKLPKSKTIRHIDSIEYIADYTKGDNLTGAYCGASVIAMLAGISLDEAVKLMEGIPASKAGLKQVLDYYGIRYAPKSAHFDPNVPLPEICILRFYILDENGNAHTGFGHWGLYYMGKFYDPDWGICDECPKRLRLFQIWEIYK